MAEANAPATKPISRSERLIRIALYVFLVIGLSSLAAAVLMPVPKKLLKDAKPQPPASEPGFVLPSFSLTERNGQAVSKDDLKGKVWVASFIFSRCTGPCPTVTATMTNLQAELDLANQPNLRLVTFTVDPQRDTPVVLKKYADNFRASNDRWLFLTGQEEEIHSLLKNGFKIGVNRSPDPHPVAGQEFEHSTFITVVDKNGVVRGHFNGIRGANDTDGERYKASQTALKALVAELLKE